jgi:hypothetical protein
MRFQATASAPQSEQIKLLEGGVLPKLRGTITSCDIHLLYAATLSVLMLLLPGSLCVCRCNLGLLTRKSHMVVDVSFARICSDIISRFSCEKGGRPRCLSCPQLLSSPLMCHEPRISDSVAQCMVHADAGCCSNRTPEARLIGYRTAVGNARKFPDSLCTPRLDSGHLRRA